jgi:hypothetical protein
MKLGDKGSKPPLLRQALTQPITLIGGYMIRRVTKDDKNLENNGVNLVLTTFDHKGFSLEIMFDQLVTDVDSYGIKIEKTYNLLIISLKSKTAPEGAEIEVKEEIHIGAPMGKRVEGLQIGHPMQNGGKIIITAV